MTDLKSALDTRFPEFKRNVEAMAALVADLRETVASIEYGWVSRWFEDRGL